MDPTKGGTMSAGRGCKRVHLHPQEFENDVICCLQAKYT